MTISYIQAGLWLLLALGTEVALIQLFLSNARHKAENERLLKLYDSLKEEFGEWEDCEPELEALRKSFAGMNAQILEALPEHDSKLRGHAVALDQLEARNKELSAGLKLENAAWNVMADVQGVELDKLRESFASMNGFLAAENGRLLDFSVRLDAIDLWIQSKAPQPPTRNAKGRFTKQKR